MTLIPPGPLDSGLEQLSEDECRWLLSETTVGRVAFVVDGFPVVLPVNYRFISAEPGPWIVFRSQPGHAVDRAPDEVAFEIDGVDYDQHQGWSVLCSGALHHLDDDEISQLMQRFDPDPWPQWGTTSWLAIRPRSLSGRRLRGLDHEWEFPSEAYL